jgi:hypothetical protein
MVAAVLAAVVVEKWATDPDSWRTFKMRAARVAEAAAMRAARGAADLAAAAHEVYRGECAR